MNKRTLKETIRKEIKTLLREFEDPEDLEKQASGSVAGVKATAKSKRYERASEKGVAGATRKEFKTWQDAVMSVHGDLEKATQNLKDPDKIKVYRKLILALKEKL